MSEQLTVIENEHKRLTDLHTNLSEFVTKCENELKRINDERNNAVLQMKEFSGAMQAYKNTLGLFNPAPVEAPAEVVPTAVDATTGEVIEVVAEPT